MMILERIGIGLLRLLIGIGFTFSLVIGVTLTLLTLCDGTGKNLTFSRTGLHWEWSIPAVVALTLTLFCWLGWRCLPVAKPTQMFPIIERVLFAPILTVLGTAILFIAVLGAVCDQVLHRQAHHWFAILLYGTGAMCSWTQLTQLWRSKRRRK